VELQADLQLELCQAAVGPESPQAPGPRPVS
jgi:hypothetical protein